jgi:hypothetical protein
MNERGEEESSTISQLSLNALQFLSTMKLIIASTFLFASATAFSGAYLDQLVSTNNAPTGGGVGGYLDYLPASPAAPTAGAGLFNHLDSLGGRSTPAPFVPAPAAPAPVAPAPVARAPVPVASR